MVGKIQELKLRIEDLETQLDATIFTYNQADRECEALRKLCAEAAEALEKHGASDLIQKLRDAAR